MKNKKIFVTSTLVMSMFSVSGLAMAEEEVEKSLWKASAELGYVSTSGNSETESLNAKMMVSTDREDWRHKAEASALQSSSEDATTGLDEETSKKFNFMAQSDYKLEGKNFLFGVVTYENDKFSGYDFETSEAVGYGRRVIEDEDMILDLEIGPGARQFKNSGTTHSEKMIRAAVKFDWTLSKTSKFSEVLTVENGEDVTVTKSVTSLSSQINGSLSMKISYTYKKSSEVPDPAIDDTDTETAVTLVYSFN